MTLAKVVLIFLAIASSSPSSATEPQPVSLDYGQLIPLDAEELAETGIGNAYKQLLAELKKHVQNPAEIEEIIDCNLPRYAIRANGSEYVVYSHMRRSKEGESWGTATYVFFKIVNDQLSNSAVRFYAISGGNDLGGMFLTPQQAKESRQELSRPTDWPYLPEPDGPWYGQQH